MALNCTGLVILCTRLKDLMSFSTRDYRTGSNTITNCTARWRHPWPVPFAMFMNVMPLLPPRLIPTAWTLITTYSETSWSHCSSTTFRLILHPLQGPNYNSGPSCLEFIRWWTRSLLTTFKQVRHKSGLKLCTLFLWFKRPLKISRWLPYQGKGLLWRHCRCPRSWSWSTRSQ
jgi:hypothetical protein